MHARAASANSLVSTGSAGSLEARRPRRAFASPAGRASCGVGARRLQWTHRILVVGLLLLAVAVRAETITIATYNVENYVAANRLVDGVYREAYPKPEAAKTALRSVIRALDADVLALQEIGPLPYLTELQRDLKNEGLDYPHAAWLEAADPERHVAVLSKRPFVAVNKHADLAFLYFKQEERVKRGLLEVRVASGDSELTLFVVHLKSRFTDRADDPESALRRAGEAGAITCWSRLA
mgnify:CR=1 FL=1